MGFNKRQHLQKNIEALRIAFTLERENRQATEQERLLMMQYSGFGGLKFILNPAEKETDIINWKNSERDLFPLTQELDKLLKENANDEKQYLQFVDSMRSSVLTAFYTPPEIISALANTLKDQGIEINRMLEPSAGSGSFIEAFQESFDKIKETSAYEKELLTGKILSQIYPNANVNIRGFETISENEELKYDLVTSNIPFGDVSVFDLSYSRSKDLAKIQAARSIHNYFFLKGGDMLRDGGILAFITSQGVLNSPNNLTIRKKMMQNYNLVSAVRLPNNLFKEYAGTEVGSDLIVLQKYMGKQELSLREQEFCDTIINFENTSTNVLLNNPDLIIHTKSYKGTDPYGKATIIFEHEGGVDGIASDLKKILHNDFSTHLDLHLYNEFTAAVSVKEPIIITSSESNVQKPILDLKNMENKILSISNESVESSVQMSLFDLFEIVVPEKIKTAKPKVKTKISVAKRNGNRRAPNLFDIVTTQERKQNLNFQKPILADKSNLIYEDLFSQANSENSSLDKIGRPNSMPSAAPTEPSAYLGAIYSFHRDNCLVVDNGFVGYLKNVNIEAGKAMFHPLKLSTIQRNRAIDYIAFRDVYHTLYNHEAELRTEHKTEREKLNQLYDAFVKKYG